MMQTCCGCGKELGSDRLDFDLYAMCEGCLREAEEFKREHTPSTFSSNPRDYFDQADAATIERTRQALAAARTTLDECLVANREAETEFDQIFVDSTRRPPGIFWAASVNLGLARRNLAAARADLSTAYDAWSLADPYESYMEFMGALTGND
jgi:hypothetical protein